MVLRGNRADQILKLWLRTLVLVHLHKSVITYLKCEQVQLVRHLRIRRPILMMSQLPPKAYTLQLLKHLRPLKSLSRILHHRRTFMFLTLLREQCLQVSLHRRLHLRRLPPLHQPLKRDCGLFMCTYIYIYIYNSKLQSYRQQVVYISSERSCSASSTTTGLEW